MAVSPPSPRLPPLNALRAFEAAARLGGFAAAANELRVTPGAVAAHVKALEEDLGAPLFERHSRGVRLTPLGQRALPDFTAGFDALAGAVLRLRRAAAPGRVHVAALPALAQLWLAPRLPRLRAAFPGLDLSVTALERPPNLKRAPFDLALFYCDTLPVGALDLGQDEIFPVCAPELAAGLTRPGDVLGAVCLSDASWSGDWAAWVAVALPGRVFMPRGPVFSLYALAVAAAVSGAGVLMGHGALVGDDLVRGSLVRPFGPRVILPRRLALWAPRGGGGAAAAVAAALAAEGRRGHGAGQALDPAVGGL